MSDNNIAQWLAVLQEEDIVAWANRGLLRRGKKLYEQLDSKAIQQQNDGYQLGIDSQVQTVTDAGFEALSCSCAATGPCHHLVASLLLLKSNAASTDEVITNQSPWLMASDARIKALGKSYVNQATRLLLQGISVELSENERGLVADIVDKQAQQVRIPRVPGLQAATCTCKAQKCVHKALAVLKACQEHGLYDLQACGTQALGPAQLQDLQLAEEWLREVVIQGLAQVSSELIERGNARAVAVRQAGFPRIAKLMTELGELLRASKDRAMYLTVQHCQRKIASIHASITALRQSPLPQTLTRLAGQYRRSYFPEQDLSMVAVGAEQWQSQSGYHGLSLYLFAIDKGHWYQYRQARPVNVDREWSPERAWRQESWCGVAFQSITGCRLTFNTLNVSLDRSITTTEHSNITLGAGDVKQLPVVYDFTGLRRYYYANSMPLNYDYLPVIVHVHACQQPYFDTAQQMGMQHIADQWDNPLKLTISTGQLTAKAYDYLDNQWHNSKKPQYVFGMLYLLDELLVVRAISVIFQGETQWKHMTLP